MGWNRPTFAEAMRIPFHATGANDDENNASAVSNPLTCSRFKPTAKKLGRNASLRILIEREEKKKKRGALGTDLDMA